MVLRKDPVIIVNSQTTSSGLSCIPKPRLGQCWPNVGTTVPTWGQHWANQHCSLSGYIINVLCMKGTFGEPRHVHRLTTHLFSNERADWPQLHDMSKVRDAKTRQREFPVGFPVGVCTHNLLSINIFHDVVARIESRCMIKAKHVLLVC